MKRNLGFEYISDYKKKVLVKWDYLAIVKIARNNLLDGTVKTIFNKIRDLASYYLQNSYLLGLRRKRIEIEYRKK